MNALATVRCARPSVPFALTLAISAMSLASCATTSEAVADKENQLLAAGFQDRPANTPKRQAMLQKLPANKFVRRVRDDQVAFVYADPKVCNCLYVGTQEAYGKYRSYMQQRNLADEKQMTANEFNDPGWNWGAWGGSWGSWRPGFWGAGPGW